MKDLYGNDDIEAMYQAALAVPLAEKIDMAIALIRSMEKQALSFSDSGYYVAFSGGKDSIVLERLFAMSGVKYEAWYNNVTIDPPELVQFIKRQYPQVKWNNPIKHLWRHMLENPQGLPTRVMRWCCQVYKEQGGNGLFKAVGVRAPESPRRKGLWQLVRFIPGHHVPIMAPILYWTDADVWQFIRDHEMPYCSLYDEGFKRLGCIGCPMGNRSRDFQRWPKYGQLWKKFATDWINKWKDIPRRDGKPRSNTQYTPDQYWSWWMEEKNVNDTDTPDCQLWLW